jgi:outer membrane protein assembly factor BamB
MLTIAKNLPEEWRTNKNIAWTYKLDGIGWSSPIIWSNKVFITSTFPEKVAPVHERGPMPGPGPEGNDTTFKQDIYRWELTCVDLNTGKELWKQVAYHGNPKVSKQPMNTYASETPVTDGKRVYAYFGMTGLFCYDMNGNQLWQKDLGAYNTQGGWGTGSSPVISNGILYMQIDNEVNSFIIALDAATGEEKWRTQRDEKTNYSTPYIWKNNIRTEIVTCGKTARSYNPVTGKLLWELKTGGEQTIPSPVGDENNIYLGNAGGQEIKGNLYAIKAGAEGNISPKEGDTISSGVVWIFPDPDLGNTSPLLYKGLIYIISSRGGEIKCINAENGSLVYKDRISGLAAVWASLWAYNDKIWFFDEKGITRSFKAGEEIEMVTENKLDGKFWSSVAITGDAYVFKGVEALYCVKK